VSESGGWNRDSASLRRQFPQFRHVTAEWAYHHHGLRWLPQSVKDYIRQRDIMDVGASVGDSLTILVGYTNRRVISYEIDPAVAAEAKKNSERLPHEKFMLLCTGISNVARDGTVPMSTIDAEVKKLNLTVGLIKADVEGVEPEVVLGALETIRRDRPVLAMAIYHNIELLDLPRMLVQLGYKLRFQFGQYSWYAHWELACIAIPNGLAAATEEEKEELNESAKCHEYG
jgi:hypothetical protein